MRSSEGFGLTVRCALFLLLVGAAQAQEMQMGRVYAFGLTHEDHRNEIGGGEEARLPIVFEKAPSSLAERRSHNHFLVRHPSRTQAIAGLEPLDARMAAKYRSNKDDLTALLDYEVEVGFMVTAPVDLRNIEQAPRWGADLKFFLANDVSLRSIQILGEGRDDKFAFWGASKSFNDFLVLSQKQVEKQDVSLDRFPTFHYELKVNGEVRQSSDTSKLLYSPRQMLESLRERLGVLRLNPGDIVLTGTSGGTAFKVSAFSRWMADLFHLPSTMRLNMFMRRLSAADKAKFLKADDIVEMNSPELGELSFKID